MNDFNKVDWGKDTTLITNSDRVIYYTAGLGGERRKIKIPKRVVSFMETTDFYNTSINDVMDQQTKSNKNTG